MKILILGATGRTGKLILEEALNQGYGQMEQNSIGQNSVLTCCFLVVPWG